MGKLIDCYKLLIKHKEKVIAGIKALSLCLITIVSGVVNTVTFAIMAQKMYGLSYAPFLIYSTTILSIIGFFLAMLILTPRKKGSGLWPGPYLLHYILFAMLWGSSNILTGFADPFVDGDLQSILALGSLPGTWLGTRLILQRKSNWFQIISIIMVLGGAIMAVVPPFINNTAANGENSSWIASLTFFIGMTFSSGVDILQEKLYVPPMEVDLWESLFWGNVFSLPLVFLSSFFTMIPGLTGTSFMGVLDAQLKACQCFIGYSLPQNCHPGTFWWVLGYSVTCIVYYWGQAELVRSYSAVFLNVVLAFVVPFSAITFWIKPFVGEDVEPFEWYILVSIVIVTTGALIYRVFAPSNEHETLPETQQSSLRKLEQLANKSTLFQTVKRYFKESCCFCFRSSSPSTINIRSPLTTTNIQEETLYGSSPLPTTPYLTDDTIFHSGTSENIKLLLA